MPSELPSLRRFVPRTVASSLLLVASLFSATALAQDETPSLGDVARDLRNKPQPQPQQTPESGRQVIDNDNLTQVMDDAKRSRPIAQDKTVFSIDPASNTLKVSSPDVTCSLSFNAKASALLIKPVLVEDLPLTELLKIDGPGSIQDENLQLEVFNGTDWDLREITIGLTLERKPGENAELAAHARVLPAAEGLAPVTVERRSDVTLLYHLKAEAKPFTTTAFHENIGITPGPDEDWRWSIVEAKGIRPTQTQAPSDSPQEPMFATPSALLPGTNDQQPALGPTATPLAPAGSDDPAPNKPSVEKPSAVTPSPQH
jgi:hypothetical protein